MREQGTPLTSISLAALIALAGSWAHAADTSASEKFMRENPSLLVETSSPAEVEQLGEIAEHLGYQTLAYELRADGLWIMKLLVPIPAMVSVAPPPPPPLPECPGRSAATPFRHEVVLDVTAV